MFLFSGRRRRERAERPAAGTLSVCVCVLIHSVSGGTLLHCIIDQKRPLVLNLYSISLLYYRYDGDKSVNQVTL